MTDEPMAADAETDSSYKRGAQILALGIASTGVLTFAYFAAAGHALSPASYGRVAQLWAVLFIVMSVLYRPVEQLLSRSIADRRARGVEGGHSLRGPALLQAGFATLFVVVALIFRVPIEDNFFDGFASLYWILVGAAVAYAASYFARGYLAGHEWFALYGGLVFFEALARLCFPLAVLAGLASGQTAVALGILAAPFASLLVVPVALVRHRRRTRTEPTTTTVSPKLSNDARFAGSVALIQLAEQTLLNAAVLLIPGKAASGIAFSALLIARAPLQLFQAIQTSLLPHLAGLEATEGHAAFSRAIRQTAVAIAAFAALVTAGLLIIGPWAMETIFDAEPGQYDRGLALLGVGMGFHLIAGTLTQAALARDQAHQAAATWLVCAAGFVVWMLAEPFDSTLLRTEVGYVGAAFVLSAGLLGIYRIGGRSRPA